MTTHASKILAELSGTLMSVDSEDVRVGDVMFMGGHLVLRVLVAPHLPRLGERVDPEHFAWQGAPLDAPTDGTYPPFRYQVAIGQPRLILRPAVRAE